MSPYRDFANDHFSMLTHRPPPLEEERFWSLVDQLGWGVRDEDEVKAWALEHIELPELLSFHRRLELFTEPVAAAFEEVRVKEGWALPEGFWSDDIRLVVEHVVALGRARFEAERGDFEALYDRVLSKDYSGELGMVLYHEDWVAAATDEAIERALRRGGVVRDMDDAEGLGTGELVEHPEHGLGFVVIDRATHWMWLLFPDIELSTRRHARPTRAVTLYNAAGDWFWFASVGRDGGGGGSELFVCSGAIGYASKRRIYPPRVGVDVETRLEALMQTQREAGFEERLALADKVVALQLTNSGLVVNPQVAESAADMLSRLLRESGNGDVTHKRVAHGTTHLFARVVRVESAASSIEGRLAPGIPALGEDFTIVAIEEGGEARTVFDATGEEREFTLELVPCDVREELPYFSKLSIQPHPETDAWAQGSAAEAAEVLARDHDVELDGALDSLERLDGIIARLRERLEAGGLPEEALEQVAAHLGSYAGELVRRSGGGAWGVGTIFTERLWYGLLVGDSRVKWWPVREARQWIEGKREGAFSARCRRMLEAGAAPRDPALDPGARLYPLAGDAGYFDAGHTRDGRQVLMGAFYTGTFGLFFDAEGHLLEYATTPPVEGRHEGEPTYGPSRKALVGWQEALGFEPGTIHVRQFSNSEQGVGIEPLPSHYVDFLEDPGGESGEAQEEMEKIERWIEAGEFVLYWGNDLWLDARGHVTST